jgi:gliding motility-associated-like protein
MRYLLGFIFLVSFGAKAQTYVFAQLNGTPVNTTGWVTSGAAVPGNVTGSGNSELVLCQALNNQSGAIFYNQPINLNQCFKWVAEFDFRMYGGTSADGIAFCFLDVPPTGFVSGGGLGIPASANGLKVCFDTYLNCAATGSQVPKIELRWGAGYDECWAQPTLQNTGGTLSFIRSFNYAHAKVVYNNGNIDVYVNNTLYLSGFQQFTFNGYLGFTASTGGSTDIHSIKNVVIYTDVPPSVAGLNQTICSGQSLQLGTTPDPNFAYAWTPGTNLSATNIANPVFSLVNATSNPISQKYYVNTSFLSGSGCASKDSITVTVLPAQSVSIAASNATICSGTSVNFTATPTNAGSTPVYQWKVNGVNAGTNSATFNSSTLANGDVVTCEMTGTGSCSATSNSITMTVSAGLTPGVTITGSPNTICAGTTVNFTATASNEGTSPSFQWTVNGVASGTNSSTFSSGTLANGDIVQCTLTSSLSCTTTSTANSNSITMTVNPLLTPVIAITASPSVLCPNTTAGFTAVATNGGTAPSYQWKKNGTNVGINSSSYSDNTLVNGDIITCVLTSNAGCVTTATANSNNLAMQVSTNPVVTLNHDPNLCVGTSRQLDAGNFASYSWSDGTTGKTISINAIGTYYVTVTDNNGCTGSDTVHLTALLPSPSNFLIQDTALCAYDKILLRPSTNYQNYLWSTSATTPSIEVGQPGWYWLKVNDANSCTGVDSVLVGVKNCGKSIWFPSAFSPNNDGKNDQFMPLLFDKVDHYSFSVYNRWGQLVFSSTQPLKGWDGTIGGLKQSSGVFIWSCTYQFDGMPLKTERGSFLLIR